MSVYLDTSVVLRILLQQPNPIDGWGQWDKAYSSALWRVETFRTIDRLRVIASIDDSQRAELAGQIAVIDESLYVVELDEAVVRRAADAFPTVVGTLDALHLASALLVREVETIDEFLTHDRQLATAALSVGFKVRGV